MINNFDFNSVPSPCYVLSENRLLKNLTLLKKVIDEAGIEIICALKGYSMWHTFPLLKNYISGGSASSLFEAKLIYQEMGVQAHTYCPVYIEENFNEILSYSSHITFNSLNQYRKYYPLINKFKSNVSTGLRVNAEYSEIKTEIYNPASKFSRFGVLSDEIQQGLPEGIEGIHFHLMCEQDSYVLERILNHVEEKFSSQIKKCKWINMGGGHLITEENYDVEHLILLLKSFKQRYPDVKIILEPGEAIGWQTGYLVSKVLDIVEKKEVNIAILDVSFSAHMPDTLEMPYKPKVLNAINEDAGNTNYKYKFGGVTCLAGDFLGDYFFKNPLKIGDTVVFDDQIHYTFVKSTFFNGVKHPSLGIFDKNNVFNIIKEFSYEEYKSRLS